LYYIGIIKINEMSNNINEIMLISALNKDLDFKD
jgi:hypothetical protein